MRTHHFLAALTGVMFTVLAGTALWAFSHADPVPSVPTRPGSPLRYMGLNLGAGGFGSSQIPGIYGRNYAYPNAREAAPFLAAGMNVVRVPVLWNRLQPRAMGKLDPVELRRIDASFAALRGFELVILDIHNYGRYGGELIDDPQSGQLLVDLWTQLAHHYGGDRRIAFGLMNEPNGIDPRAWRGVVDQVVTAIRATGSLNLVLVPGTRWTGAHNWTTGGEDSNAAAFASFRDPAGNFAYELHQYADSNSSGMHEDCIPAERAAARLDGVTAWLRQQKSRGFLGEFGVAPNAGCLAALDAMLARMGSAPDAWLGWTYWAGGDWWGRYPFSIQPDANGPKPQMSMLIRHIAPIRRSLNRSKLRHADD